MWAALLSQNETRDQMKPFALRLPNEMISYSIGASLTDCQQE
jgi:hypothetical protein